MKYGLALIALALILLFASSAKPVMASAEVAFDPMGNGNANPDGTFPAGAAVNMVVTMSTSCSSARVYWGDGTSDTGSTSTGVVHLSHAYTDGGTYTVTAVDLCDGQSANSVDVTVVGSSFNFDFSSPSAPISMAAIIGGLFVMVLANPRVRVGSKAAAGGAQMAIRGVPSGGQGVRFSTRRPESYVAGTAAPPSPPPDVFPSPITGGQGYSVDLGRNIGASSQVPEGQLLSGPGASMAPRDTSPLAFLNALWSDGRVTLTWGPPQFTGNGETLIGYEVSILKFGPNSTQPIQTILNIQPPTSNQVNLGVLQTYQHSTGGDIAGFRIDPIFGRTVDGTQTVVRGTGLFVKYGSAIGTFGL